MANQSAPHIVIAGGGTGGHLFPGLAVAAALRALEPAARVTFVSTGRPWERERVLAVGHPYHALPCRPLPRRPGEAFRFLFDNFAGYCAARRLLRGSEVDVVVGLGGYASAPVIRAAVSQRVPLVLLEQNAIPGRATRWLARRASLVCGAFEEVRAGLPHQTRLEITGNPLRREFDELRGSERQPDGRVTLLVLGGSSGAGSLNEHVPVAIHQAKPVLNDWRIIHQCGLSDAEATANRYAKRAIDAEVTPFIHNLPAIMATADLVISRAGGTTLAELAALGVPSILVPYPFAADDHQRRNADVFEAAGACRIVDARNSETPLPQRLSSHLGELAANDKLRQSMSTAASQLAKSGAAQRVANRLLELARQHAVRS